MSRKSDYMADVVGCRVLWCHCSR